MAKINKKTMQNSKKPETLKPYYEDLKKCPNCYNEFKRDYILIPTANNKKVKAYGFRCKKCNCMYIENLSSMENLINYGVKLKEKEKEKEKNRNKKNKTKTYKKKINPKFEVYKSSIVILHICFPDNNEKKEIVIVNADSEASDSNYVFNYTSDEGREFLTSAFHTSRDKKGKYKSRQYYIQKIEYSEFDYDSKIGFLLPEELTIKSKGGFNSSIVHKRFELIDLLLYSPFTKKYEIVKATYDKDDEDCFMDISKFRSFVKKFGNPNVHLFFGSNEFCDSSFDTLKDESFLKSYGYNVSQKDNLSSTDRLNILTEIVDLQLLTAHTIVRFLDFLIQTHTDPKYNYAISKWEHDKKYIMDYNINTSRFMIMKDK